MKKQVKDFNFHLWMRILMFLSEKGPHNAMQMSMKLDVTPCAVYSNLMTLEKKGFTQREWKEPRTYWNTAKDGKKEHGREKTNTLTEKGKKMVVVLTELKRLLE
jgi:predicted ArsR family transcriptional regulator